MSQAWSGLVFWASLNAWEFSEARGQRLGKAILPPLGTGPGPCPPEPAEGLAPCPSSTIRVFLQASGAHFPARGHGQGYQDQKYF